MEITYSNLNTKSHYSCGIGIGTSAEIINKAKEKGLFGIALTDKNTIAGLLDFYNTGKKLKFPVALGVEISYFNSQNKISSVLLLAKDFDGYINLCKLITASWDNEDLYNEPCVSLYDLNEYGSNLYCFINNRDQFADLKSIFNNSLFVQLILNKDNIENNKILININHQKIITCDAYIPDFNYKVLQDIMLSNSKIEDKEKINFIKPILSPIELMQEWKLNHSDYIKLEDLAYSFKTSNAIIEECSKISLKFKDQVVNFPHLLHPLNNDGCSKEELTWRIAKQYGRLKIDVKEYFDRFQYEMDSICNNSRVNLIDYFLVLEDLCRWCRENGITVGPGRGSGAGALVNYCLKITHLDPIENNLLFERFISKGRIENGTLPDVDLDFSDQDRVRTYLTEKYGTDRVLRIGTFQTLKVLGSIKDIAKSLQHKYPELDFVTVNNVTKTLGKKDLDESEIEFYERNLEENKTLQDFFSKYPEIKESTTRLVGYNRQAGQHPCFSGNTKIFTEYGYKTFEELNNSKVKILTPSGWREAIFYENGIKEVFKHKVARSKYSTMDFINIECTYEHLFKTKKGDFPLYKEQILSNFNIHQLELNHFLLGWIWNDGYFDKTSNLFVSCITPEKDKDFFNIFEEKNFLRKSKKYAYFFPKEFNEIFNNLGYDFKKTTNKQFPIKWNEWTITEKLSWFKGMFSANGFVIRKKFGIKLTSLELMQNIKIELDKLGIGTTTIFTDQPSIEWNSKPASYMYLTQQGNNTFIKAIGFVQDYKTNKILKDNIYKTQKIESIGNLKVYDFTVIDGEPYGLVEGFWAHNCGLALCQDSIINFAPIRKYKGQKILELNAPACEQSGIIKYDILGLRTLLYIQTTCDLVGIKDIYELPLDDKKTFQAFVDGDTNGVFQFNSDVAIGILNKLPVNAMSLEILSMVTSVGRPGPMGNGQHIEFYKRVRREKLATAPHPALEEELKPTYGIMIYQENVMKASQILGGFTLAEADDLRKAMGKKKPELLISYKDKFVKYCWQHYPDTKNEYRDELNIPQGITVAEHIFELMATFSGYGFCKAHAVAYALIGYYCQFLKTHYPLQWWTACLTHAKDDKLQKYYKDAEQYCLDPEINNSTNKYEIINNKIQMPISAIKGLGPKATEQIFNLRPFNSFQDFMDRINKRSINKAVVLKLIYAGCFDALHPNSHQALINYYFSEIRKEQVPNEIKEITKSQLLDLRMKSLAYLQRDLYLIYKEHFSEEPTEYENCKMSIKPLYLFGSVVSLKKRKTKNNNDMGTLTISNNGEELKITVWSDELNFFQNNLKEKNEVRVKVKTSEYNGNTQLTLINCELLGDK